MPSKIVRRSGVGVCTIAEFIGWTPDVCYQIGIGTRPEETVVMREQWPHIRFHGCEPHPDVAAEARKRYPGDVYEVAVSDYCGKTRLTSKHRHKDGSTINDLRPDVRKEKDRHYMVRVTTMDALWPEGPDAERVLLWLDCEGSELAALRGGERFLSKVQMLNVEMTGRPPGHDWCSQVDVHYWLKERGFFRQWIHTQRSAAGQNDVVYVRRELFKPEYCACPCEVRGWQESEL